MTIAYLPTWARCVALVGLLQLACAHAPPATGDRNPDAQPDPDYPEINCKLYTTVDCRPGMTR